MPVLDIKTLLDKYKISWIDRGANVGRNHINIACPHCKDDPSFHMSINMNSLQWYCFRNPRHRGNLIGYLLRALGIPAKEYVGQKLEVSQVDYSIEKDRDYSAMRYFEPAEESDEALAYLSNRHFSNPIRACQQFDLRVSRQGEWAGRLIIPLTKGWTGRSMRNHIEPRYKANTNYDGFFLFKHGASSVIICEGAIDAMRLASVTVQFDVIAKCKAQVSAAIIFFLREANYQGIYNVPDGTVGKMESFEETKIIGSYCGSRVKVQLLPLSATQKDFGAMTESEVREILAQI